MSFYNVPKDVIRLFLKHYLDPLDLPNILLTASLFHVLEKQDFLYLRYTCAREQERERMKVLRYNIMRGHFTRSFLECNYVQCNTCGGMLERKDDSYLKHHLATCRDGFYSFNDWKKKYLWFPLLKLPLNVIKLLMHDYFHPLDALKCLCVCKKLNEVANHDKIHQRVLIHKTRVVFDEYSQSRLPLVRI